MSRAEVRIIQGQSEEINPLNISKEEEDLLIQNFLNRGKSPKPTQQTSPPTQDSGETFEEMCKRLESQRSTPKPNVPNDGLDRDFKIIGDDESGLNFRVQIVSDMKLR